MGGAATGKGDVADATLNVVPTIDLLVCLICFLLVSTVWTGLNRIDVEQALPKGSERQAPAAQKKGLLQVAVTAKGYKVNAAEGPENLAVAKQIALLSGKTSICRGRKDANGRCKGDREVFERYDKQSLQDALHDLAAQLPAGYRTKVMVMCDDLVQYAHLIGAMDTVLSTCDSEGKQCLKKVSIGDIALFRAK